jgi:hypothetical protein
MVGSNKNKLFQWWTFLAVLIMMASCDEDLYVNEPPVFLVNGVNHLEDTIKITQTPFYEFEFTIEDVEDERELRVNDLTEGLLRYRGNIINDVAVDITLVRVGYMEFQALQTGLATFSLEVRASDDLISSVDIRLFVFDNLAPVPHLQLTQTDELGPYQVKLDASKSYDADHRWAGEIMKWEFTIADFYTTTIDQPVIHYVFPEPGTYSVGLRVLDNDGEWSEKLIKDIEVE